MKKTMMFLLMLIFASGEVGETQEAQRTRLFNLDDDGYALQGYDPVSYHQAQPRKGRAEFNTAYNGVRYRFDSQANLDQFRTDPDRYEPAYGGWCAWAMLEGEKVDVDPESFKLINGRLYVFYDGFWGDTLKKWNTLSQEEPEPTLVQKADTHWSKISKQ